MPIGRSLSKAGKRPPPVAFQVVTPTSFADNFNRPDEPLEASASWTRLGGAAGALRVVGGGVASPNALGATTYLAPDLGIDNKYTQATFLSGSAVDMSLLGHAASSGSFIRVYSGVGTTWRLQSRVLTGAASDLGSVFPATAAGDVIRMEVRPGTDVKWFRNGALQETVAWPGPMEPATRTGLRGGAINNAAAIMDGFLTGAL